MGLGEGAKPDAPALSVSADAKRELVGKMPDEYASNVEFEFFAELYALHYDLDDPLRGNIPADVSKWLVENIGGPEPNAPMPSAPPKKEEWETVTRPSASRK